jgi:integrase
MGEITVTRPIKVPSYRLHKPSDQAIVVIRGKTFYLGRYGSTESKDEYNRIITEWLAGSATVPPPLLSTSPKTELTVSQLVLAYWRHVESYYVKDGRQTSQVHVVRLALRPVKELYGHTPAKDFGPLALKACRANMVARGQSRKTINSLASRIRQMFRWAAEQEFLPVSVHQALTAVPGLKKGRTAAKENRPIAPVPDAVVDKTLKHLSPTLAAMVRLQRLTGARPGEIVILRTCDINRSDRIWEYVPGSHKTEHQDQQRVVFVGPQAQALLKSWLKTDLQEFVFSPAKAEVARRAERRDDRQTPVWPSHVAHLARKRKPRPRRSPRDHYSVASYRRAIARACDLAFPHPKLSRIPDEDQTDDQRAELETWQKANRWHPHQLRHSVATRVRRRFGLEAAQAVLGHTELGTTQVYAERNLEAARDVMMKIG